MVGRGNDVIDLLPPYSSKTFRATVVISSKYVNIQLSVHWVYSNSIEHQSSYTNLTAVLDHLSAIRHSCYVLMVHLVSQTILTADCFLQFNNAFTQNCQQFLLLVFLSLADRTIGQAFGTLCHLSVVCRLSVTFCIVAKRYVLAKNCLKEWIGNQGKKLIFWVAAIFLLPVSALRPPIWPFLPYFCPYSPAIGSRRYKWISSSKPGAYCRIVWSELKPEVVLATIIDLERCK